MQSNRRIATVSAVLTFVAITGGILVFNTLPAISSTVQTASTSELFQSTLSRLKVADNAQERMQAARWLGQQEASVSSEMIQTMGRSLRTDTDPAVRSTIATSFGVLAAKQNANSAGAGANEPQMLDVLSAAYSSESNPSVRARIMSAAGEFKDPNVVSLLNRGLIDSDPGVREAAQMAKLARQRKLLIAFSG